ncbi:protein DBF4 homolog B isoform X2 [Anolis carolinensis]|uniref:protein DBF4 homolog B isoform X2 n=1 Tax=Anolis carolinensis TaxID=28377 RepID=UPI002F2B3D54
MSSHRSVPLVGKSFYLDIPSGKNLDYLSENVKRLGGVIESFLSKEVTYVVSSSQEARREIWAGKHVNSVLRDTHTGALPSAKPQQDRRRPLPKPIDTALNSRGKKLLHKAIGSQDNIPGNSILASARLWGIQVVHADEMLTYIRRLSKKYPSKAKMKLCVSGYQPQKVKLRPHFLKIEDKRRQLRPFFKLFSYFPQLYFLPQRRQSPFKPPQKSSISKESNSRGLANGASPLSDGCFVPQMQKGYCECCDRPFAELWMHLHSPQHKEFVSDPSHYAVVDSIISQLTNEYVFLGTPSPRVPPAAGDGESFGLLKEVNENAIVPPLDQALQFCMSAEGSSGQFGTPKDSTHFFEDQGFLQLTALSLEVFDSTLPFALQSPGSASNLHEEASMVANSGSQAIGPAEDKCIAAPEKERILAKPAALSHKRKKSWSPLRPAKKKQALTSDKKQSSSDLATKEQQVGTPQYAFPNLSDSQAAPRRPGLCAAPSHTPICLCAHPHLPLENCSCHLSESVAIDTEYLKSPMQQLDQEEEESILRNGTCAASLPCNSSIPNIGFRSPLDFPPGKQIAPTLQGSVVQHSLPEITELAQPVLPQQPGLGPSPCLCLPSNQLTCISAEKKSSSFLSEWDGPLLCAMAAASHLPSEALVDTALLGTCVSMQDSNYEAHLYSVLWQTPQQNLPCEENNSDFQNSCTELTRAPFATVSAWMS